jgi:FkbM family methyltransferase
VRDGLRFALRAVPEGLAAKVVARWARDDLGRGRGVGARIILEVLRHKSLPKTASSFTLHAMGIDLNLEDSTVIRRLFYLGDYEGCEWRWWRWWCSQARYVMEVGANCGFYTVIGGSVRQGGSYLAFEPHPRSAESLRGNLRLNGVDHVEIIQAAMVGGPASGELPLILPDSDWDVSPAGAYIDSSARQEPWHRRGTIGVPVVQAREFFENVDLVKLDIEGQELDVLQSVDDLVLRNRPTMFIEALWHNYPLHDYLVSLARRAGYRILAVGPKDLREVGTSYLVEYLRNRKRANRDVILTTNASAGPGVLG